MQSQRIILGNACLAICHLIENDIVDPGKVVGFYLAIQLAAATCCLGGSQYTLYVCQRTLNVIH